ncbi:MAG: tRNA (adenosine(37)-N6)-dimethylallyltransferase MiaA [Bacteriovorax sp.]|jgi:tRNA dimethylallyltransferase|nr:tRNA (adenosine(37)-N6)-dimethylallyltransferase MiaA [Bacteriovorax sp.]
MNKLIILSGPTASGKTKTSIDLAEKIITHLQIPTVIVNFDSLLFYKEISIGTAKPTEKERKNIPHYMIDIASISSPMNAADFIKQGEFLIKELMTLQKCVILVGGSAFYLRALLKGMYESLSPSEEIQNKFDMLYKENGIGSIIDYLKKHDPESLANLHINDHYRLIRAALHFEMTGTKISDQKKALDSLSPYNFSTIIHPWNILHIYLDLPKEQHFNIIKERTEKMFSDGLMEEIESLIQSGFSLTEKPLRSIGYKEAIEFKLGHFANQHECIERISISTRQLAKSQRTFFNKISPKLSCNPLTDQDKIFLNVEQFIRKC